MLAWKKGEGKRVNAEEVLKHSAQVTLSVSVPRGLGAGMGHGRVTLVTSMVASEGCVVDMEETQPCSGLEQVLPFP